MPHESPPLAASPGWDPAVIERPALDSLIAVLTADDYRVVGPTVRDGAICLAELGTADQLPAGWRDEQDAGTYRLVPRGDPAVFAHANGPQSWRRHLTPPRALLWRMGRSLEDVEASEPGAEPPLAMIGVRPCDLAAIAVQARAVGRDPGFASRLDRAFIVAVDCTEPGGTCFCVSAGTGPGVERAVSTAAARGGTGARFDLALTELLGPPHRFVVRVGSERGAQVLAAVNHRRAPEDDTAEAGLLVAAAARRMGRAVDLDGAAEVLERTLQDPRWDDVADRCLTCANCTLVCPTCFCWTVDDVTDLDGEHAERWRRWDSCFTLDFSHLHEGAARSSARSRYRQWLTHKLGTWHDQFGSSGCVGCGRCITWCPVGIDLTTELRALAGGGAR